MMAARRFQVPSGIIMVHITHHVMPSMCHPSCINLVREQTRTHPPGRRNERRVRVYEYEYMDKYE